jgi:D-alanine-D-alanine ligase
MKWARVAVLRGGPSSEYEVSLNTGATVLQTLRNAAWATKDVVISRQGEWLVDGFVKTPEKALADIDVAFIALHGEYGEDGTVQRILERLRIPYTGSGPYASSVAMNKTLTKVRLKECGVNTPRYMRLTRDGVTDVVRTAQSIGRLFGPSYFVKAERGGSSIGTYFVQSEIELPQVIAKAFETSPELLVEERIIGKEATVAVLERFRDEAVYVLPPIEIIPPATTSFFDTEVKYSGATEERCPGNFSRQEKDRLMAIAHNVHTSLGLRHYSRSDFIVAKDGIYFLEVNTLPGLTSESLFPKAVAAVGSSYGDLLTHLITLAHTTKR